MSHLLMVTIICLLLTFWVNSDPKEHSILWLSCHYLTMMFFSICSEPTLSLAFLLSLVYVKTIYFHPYCFPDEESSSSSTTFLVLHPNVILPELTLGNKFYSAISFLCFRLMKSSPFSHLSSCTSFSFQWTSRVCILQKIWLLIFDCK